MPCDAGERPIDRFLLGVEQRERAPRVNVDSAAAMRPD
jgi:hypothetical protein